MHGACDFDLLEKHSSLWLDLIRLDSRGGLFSQPTMKEGLRLSLMADGLLPTFHKYSSAEYGPEEQLGMAGYKMRVALNHLRSLFDGGSVAAFLQPHFELMRQSRPQVQSAKCVRRAERLQARPHPFPHFRSQDAEEDDDDSQAPVDDTSPPTSVAHWLDMQSLIAKCLRSDGAYG